MSEPTRTIAPELAATTAPPGGGDPDRTSDAGGDSAGAPLRPSEVPGYQLLEEVGRGGMGVVYRARDLAMNREVAVKILQDRFAPDSGTATRFVEEAQITGQLQHPGIPAVYHVGALPDRRPFLAMKLIKGDTLDARLKAGAPLDPLAVFEAVSQAVGYAHAHGVIHRDLKPANVMVGAFGEVQVMDWGLAKVLAAGRADERPAADPVATTAVTEIRTRRDSDGSFTQAGSVLGTPAFMPPEQAAGELDKVDTRSDVFGLGALLCVLLTGEPPFEGKDAESVRLNAVRGRTDAAFARLDAAGADPDVIALCKRCLSFEPADRPATADDVAAAVAALRRAADDRAKQAERDKLAAEVQAAEQRKRRRTVARYATAVAAVLVCGVIGTTAGLLRADAARQAAMAAQADADAKRVEADDARLAESAARNRAMAALSDAERNSATAAAVSRYLVKDMLAAATPERAQGRPPLVADVLAEAALRLTGAFDTEPLIEAGVRLAIGESFEALGRHADASPHLGRAVGLYRRHLGSDERDTLRAEVIAAQNAARTGKAGWTELPGVIARIDTRYGTDDRLALEARRLFGLNLAQAGRATEAEPILAGVLATRRRVAGNDAAETLEAVNDLGVALFYLKRHRDAEPLLAEALAGRERRFGPTHPTTLESMNNVAAVWQATTGRTEDALALLRRVWELSAKVRGADHPDTLSSLNNLGMAHEAKKDFDAAADCFEDAAKAAERTLGPLNPLTIKFRHNQAANMARMKNWHGARKLLADLLPKARAALPRDSTDLLQVTQDYGLVLVYTDSADQAVPLLTDVLAARTAAQGADAPDTVSCAKILLFAMQRHISDFSKEGRTREAVPVIDEYVRRALKLPENRAAIYSMIMVRHKYFVGIKDGRGCRATAELWESCGFSGADNFYDSAVIRGAAAQAFRNAGDAGEAEADYAKAMDWLTRAVQGGFRRRDWIEASQALAGLRDRPEFLKLVASLPHIAPPPRPVR